MTQMGLTSEDENRIREYLEKPAYDQDPEDLVPDST